MDNLENYIKKKNNLTKILVTMSLIISMFFMVLFTAFITTLSSSNKLNHMREINKLTDPFSEHQVVKMLIFSFVVLLIFTAFFIVSVQLKSVSSTDELEKILKGKNYTGSEKREFFGLDSIKYRIQKHISSVKGYALSNLIIGTSISIFGIFFVFNILNGNFNGYAIDYSKVTELGYKGFFIIFIVPKLSIAFMIQIFSYFFLSMYRANLREVRYFQVELNDVDLIQEAIVIFDSEKEKIPESEKHIINKIFDVVDLRGREIRKSISSDEMIETLNSLSGNADIISKLKSILGNKK